MPAAARAMVIRNQTRKIPTQIVNPSLPDFLTLDKSVMPTGNIQNFRFAGGEDFLTPAPLGTAGDVYPMMKGYDFSEDTSKVNGRPVGKRGVYRSSRTYRVEQGPADANGVAYCRMHYDTVDQRYYIGALTSSFQMPRDGWGQLYGLWMVRFKRGYWTGSGYKVAYLLWPALTGGQTAPNSGLYVYKPWDFGEMDCPETWTVIHSFVHYATGLQGASDRGNAAWYTGSAHSMDVWHTCSMIWTPGQVQIYVDNVRIINHTGEGVPFEKMFVAYQNETNLGATPPAETAVAETMVDYLVQFTHEPGLGVAA